MAVGLVNARRLATAARRVRLAKKVDPLLRQAHSVGNELQYMSRALPKNASRTALRMRIQQGLI